MDGSSGRVAPGRYAVLYPLVAEAARRAGADAVGLVDLGCGAGFNLQVDRVGITYGPGPVLGDPASPVQVTASVVGGRPVAWVSAEGVGVAPSVPTLGDRPASGHSILAVTLAPAPAEAVGRAWSRGRLLSWVL